MNNVNMNNLTLMTDSYKLCHHLMYPELTEAIYSYFEARKGATYNKTIFFGLQYILQEFLAKGITEQDIIEGKLVTGFHLGDESHYNEEMWRYILEEHGGKIPVRIKAVPEGTPVDINNVMMTVESLDDKITAPLTNSIESMLTHVWGTCTLATLSREIRILCKHYLTETGCGLEGLDFMLHDFGYRGAAGHHAAAINGMGHLISFKGTDTIPAMLAAHNHYDADFATLAYSIPASEHSVMTALKEEGEKEQFKRMLTQFPTGVMAVVIDSYNYRRFILEYAKEFKDLILARDGKLVFRPDSGEPFSVTIEVLEALEEVFGTTRNEKKYKVLNPKVGAIWGDGIAYAGIRGILFTMESNNWAASNIVFGMGGGLHQQMTRDTQRFAFKSSSQKRDGEWHDVYKKPLDASKASKRGKLALIINDKGNFETVPEGTKHDLLETVFENGEVVKTYTFEEVRANAQV